jgi:hypothetical protein
MRLRERPQYRLRACFVTLLALSATVGVGVGTATAATTGATGSSHHLGASAPSPIRVAPASAGAAQALVTLPSAVNLRNWALTPGNQGAINSCVAWVVDYALLGWYSNFTGRGGAPFAPMYTYSQINGGGDYGSDPTAALDIARTQGTDTVAHYTKGATNWTHLPTAAERANAAQYKISGYDVLFTGANQSGVATALKTALAANRPVAIKLAVRNGFDYIGPLSTDTDRDTTSAIRGYHEVLAVGYDAAGLVVQNSWGTGWASGGFGRISWAVVQHDVWEGETIRGFAPRLAAPTVRVAVARHTGARTSATTTPMTITWNGTGGTAGPITRYAAWFEVDAHAPVALLLTSATASSVRINARIGHHYRISVRARTATTIGPTAHGSWFYP